MIISKMILKQKLKSAWNNYLCSVSCKGMDKKDYDHTGYQIIKDVSLKDECPESMNGQNSYMKEGCLLFQRYIIA